MSYTAPAGDAINFSWVDAPSYTPPNGDAVNFAWGLSPKPPACTLQSLSVQSIEWKQSGNNLLIDLRIKGRLRV